MTKYIRKWEVLVHEHLNEGKLTVAFLEDHYRRIRWLQHERLVHLLVMVFTASITLVVFGLLFVWSQIWLGILFVVVLILTLAYIRHYYILENTVQRWYELADEMEKWT